MHRAVGPVAQKEYVSLFPGLTTIEDDSGMLGWWVMILIGLVGC